MYFTQLFIDLLFNKLSLYIINKKEKFYQKRICNVILYLGHLKKKSKYIFFIKFYIVFLVPYFERAFLRLIKPVKSYLPRIK